MKEPTNKAKKISNKIISIIKEEIKKSDNIISFSKFMQTALYANGLGYYSNSVCKKFGKGGDFITAPMLGKLFAFCLTNQLIEIFANNKNNTQVISEYNILELGSGDGTLAYQLIKNFYDLGKNNDLELNSYLIVELSAELRNRQKNLLLNSDLDLSYKKRIFWINKIPENFIGVIIANEVLDALPVNLFSIKNNQIFEKAVTLKNNKFDFIETKANSNLLKEIIKLPVSNLWDNYNSEICLLIPDFIKSLANKLKRGSILLFDYGSLENDYYSIHRNCGSLRCYYQHHVHYNPFFWPGLQDITSHVNFSAVINAALSCDLKIASFSSLAQFLINNQLEQKLTDCLQKTKQTQLEQYLLHQELATLISPSEMGEIFKALHITKD